MFKFILVSLLFTTAAAQFVSVEDIKNLFANDNVNIEGNKMTVTLPAGSGSTTLCSYIQNNNEFVMSAIKTYSQSYIPEVDLQTVTGSISCSNNLVKGTFNELTASGISTVWRGVSANVDSIAPFISVYASVTSVIPPIITNPFSMF